MKLVGAIGGVLRLTLAALPVALLMLALAGVAWALELRLPPGLPDVYCDRTRIRRVIINLWSNAALYRTGRHRRAGQARRRPRGHQRGGHRGAGRGRADQRPAVFC